MIAGRNKRGERKRCFEVYDNAAMENYMFIN